MNISNEDFGLFWGAYVYGHINPLTWLYHKLLEIKQAVSDGEIVLIDEGSNGVVEVGSLNAFYEWVKRNFPDYLDSEFSFYIAD